MGRLRGGGRRRPGADLTDITRSGTNIIPKNRSYSETVDGYIRLYQRLLSDRVIAERVRSKLRFVKDPVYHGEYSRREQLRIVGRLLTRGVLKGGAPRVYHFV